MPTFNYFREHTEATATVSEDLYESDSSNTMEIM